MKKKDYLFIILIVVAFVVIFIASQNVNAKNESEVYDDDLIEIKITGEIIYDDYSIKAKKGVTYGEVINKIKMALNRYSVVNDVDYKTRYYESCTIEIKSSDIKPNKVITEDKKDTTVTNSKPTKIRINTATYEELITLPNIGDKRAKKIIEYRTTKKIARYDELKKLLGVSDAVITEIKKKAVL